MTSTISRNTYTAAQNLNITIKINGLIILKNIKTLLSTRNLRTYPVMSAKPDGLSRHFTYGYLYFDRLSTND